MRDEYYRGELLVLVDEWPVEKIDNYIQQLEARLEHTRDQIRALKDLKRRKLRNSKLKDTGARDGR